MMNVLKVATGIKFNSQDIVTGAITVQVALLPLILVWGLTLETLHAFQIFAGSFDLRSFFSAAMEYELGACALMATGSAHAYFKKETNADGSVSESDGIDVGPQRPKTTVNQTIVVPGA